MIVPALDRPDRTLPLADRPASRLSEIARIVVREPGPRVHHASGAFGAATALALRQLSRTRPVVAVTADVESARALAADASFLLGATDANETESTGGESGPVLLFLPTEASPYDDVSPDRRAAQARLATLLHLAAGRPWRLFIAPITGLSRKVPPPEEILEHTEIVVAGQEIDRDALVARLSASGYVRSPLVEDPGAFAARGALLDVWAPAAEHPVRIEMYGDLVLCIKSFDADDQRSLRELSEVSLPPVREAIQSAARIEQARERVRAACDAVDLPSAKTRALVDEVSSGRAFLGGDAFLPAFVDLETLTRYLPDDAIVVLEDPPALTRALRADLEHAAAQLARKTSEPHFPLTAFFEPERSVADWLGSRTVLALHRSATVGTVGDPSSLERFEAFEGDCALGTSDQGQLERAIRTARQTDGKGGALEPLVRRIDAWRGAGLAVFIAARAQTQVERLVSLLRHQGVLVRAALGGLDGALLDAAAASGARSDDPAWVVAGSLARGVVAPAEGVALVTEEEIFGARAHRRSARTASQSTTRAFLEDLRTLTVGDLVVHVEHGVGRYLGLSHKSIGGVTIDLVAVEYAGGDKLYLPVYRLNQIQKLAGGEGTAALDRLGGQSFAKTKARAKKNVRQLADELLRLYAERRAAVGDALPPPDDEYSTFEATFPFDETPDQARAIADVERDLTAPNPMDRLVCGDVGFGKTEVALRATFRVATSGRQVAVLCPTTVLAQQHLMSFSARLGAYPLVVRALSRFQSKTQQDDTLRRLRDGSVDVVIGTHRLLSKDVHFKRLGLLVVDEEQRFGVAHKERIKALKTHVDVLTLSATPIPRTLQMAVSGLRDMSIITTPPVDRRAIRTVVTRPDPAVLREAIARELDRGGQVFYVYNRVEGLYERANNVQRLVPSARVCIAHGQLAEQALEQTMLDFVEGRYDVLCTTAIIESGLDIPRANTMVIDRADLFGLAQLYQLRGRVGRSRERAYCYLVVPPAAAMTDDARTRIEALERHTELGSGFQIASLDLELRGAGDLLGAEQSGTVASVGFELFCQMLEEAVHELRGEPLSRDVDPELSFDVEALLPDQYVADVGVRLCLYKRLASAHSPDEVADLSAEMEDRFGPPPAEARRFVHLMRLKTELRRLRALGCEATARAVTVHLSDDTRLDSAKILGLVRGKRSPYRLTPDMRLSRRTQEGESFSSGLEAADKLLAELSVCLRDD